MADIYLRSGDGDNADDGSTWALAKKTYEDGGMSSAGDGAGTAAGAGGRVFASSNHAEEQSTGSDPVTIDGGTINAPIQILSVDDTQPEGSEVLKAGASIANVQANESMNIRDYNYSHGTTFKSGRNILFTTTIGKSVLEDCTLQLTGTGDNISIGTNFVKNIIFLNTNIDLGEASNKIIFGRAARFLWNGGSLITTVPTVLFSSVSTEGSHVVTRNVDLSILNTNLVQPATGEGFYDYLFQRCKLHADLTILQSAINEAGGCSVRLHSCDVGNTTYNIIEEHYEGSIIDETTIVRTGGQSDGTTPLSLKMTTNANAVEFVQPLVSPPLATRKIKTLGLNTLTVEFIHDSLTNLQNDDIWMEAEDSTGATVQGRITNDKLASILGTPADQPSSTATWDTSGLTNPNTQKLSVDITLLKLGPITIRVYVAKPSTTAYLDFKVTVS